MAGPTTRQLEAEISRLRENTIAAIASHLRSHHKYGEEAVEEVVSQLR